MEEEEKKDGENESFVARFFNHARELLWVAFSKDVKGRDAFWIFLSFAVFATAILLSPYLIDNHYPISRIFNALFAMGIAFLIIAYAGSSKNVVVHVAGFLVLATLIVSTNELQTLWSMAFKGEDAQIQLQAGTPTDLRRNNRDNYQTAQSVVTSLYQHDIVNWNIGVSDQELTDAFVCMFQISDLLEVATEVETRGAIDLLESFYENRGAQALFRPAERIRTQQNYQYLLEHNLVNEDHQLAQITADGCRVVRHISSIYSSISYPPTEACTSWPARIAQHENQVIPDDLLRPDLDPDYVFDPGKKSSIDRNFGSCWSSIRSGALVTARSSPVEPFIMGARAAVPQTQPTEIALAIPGEGQTETQQSQTLTLPEGGGGGLWLSVEIPEMPSPDNWNMTVSLTAPEVSGLDPVLSVFDESSYGLIAQSDDFGGTFNSQVTVPVHTGQSLLINADEFWNNDGELELDLRLSASE